MQIRTIDWTFFIFVSIVISCSPGLCAKWNSTILRRQLDDLDGCMIQSLFSYVYKQSHPPTTTEGLQRSCKTQAEGFKCLKEKTKILPGFIKRGIHTFMQNRQRYNKKICTNLASETTKKFLAATKCIMEKKFPLFKQIDSNYSNGILEIERLNFNDSAIELKYLCCTILTYKRSTIDNIEPECKDHKSQIEEMFASIVPNDVNLICEDEEKLQSKICPFLAPLKIPQTFDLKPGNSPATNSLYLVATLGEPEERNKR